MAGMILPWHRPLWQRACKQDAQLPHAILLAGPAGQGKREFAEALAARLLCERPRDDGHACGQCSPCRWREAGNHPDLHRVLPGGESADDAEGAEAEAGEGAKPARSGQILIEQIRALQAALVNTAHHGSRRVVIIDPAEAMNPYTANALLKLLEEPPAGCVFLLITHRPRQLLPTILSRCQRWPCPRPPAALVHDWLATQKADCPPQLLALCDGLPLAASRLAARDGARLVARFINDLGSLPAADALRLAEQWDKWLKSKEAAQSGFDLPTLIGWMLRWVSDLCMVRLDGPVRFFPQEAERIRRLAAQASVASATACYNRMLDFRRMAQHPLNTRLVLEDMLMRYMQLFAGART